MAKKIGIISDTHGLLRPEILEILKTCDCILHAGDVTSRNFLMNFAVLLLFMLYGAIMTENGRQGSQRPFVSGLKEWSSL